MAQNKLKKKVEALTNVVRELIKEMQTKRINGTRNINCFSITYR